MAEWLVKAVIQYQEEEIKPLRLAIEREKRLLAECRHNFSVCELCHLLCDPFHELQCEKCCVIVCGECEAPEFERCDDCDELMCPECWENRTDGCDSCDHIICEDCMDEHACI